MRPAILLTAPALAVLLLISGCTAPGSGLYAGPTGVPLEAPNVIGDGDFPLRVKVVQEHGGGPHLVGAPIVVFHIEKPHSAPTVHQLMRKNATLGGRTGPDGVLTVNLEKGQTYTFLTQPDNWTAESRHLVRITDELRDQPLLITVFRLGGSVDLSGKVPLTLRPELPGIYIGLSGGPSVRWWPVEVKLHEMPASSKQYLYRLRHLDATMTHPAANGYAELGLRVGLIGEGAQPVYYDRDYAFGLFGPINPSQPEKITLGPGDLAMIATLKNPVLKIGPFSHDPVLVAQCLPWTIHIDFQFDTTPFPTPRRPYHYGTTSNDDLGPPTGC